jgi:hypothetical protein
VAHRGAMNEAHQHASQLGSYTDCHYAPHTKQPEPRIWWSPGPGYGDTRRAPARTSYLTGAKVWNERRAETL